MQSGYRFGLSQTVLPFKLSLVIPKDFSAGIIDEWIHDALEVNPESYLPIMLQNTVIDPRYIAYVSRLLLVTTVLLQDIRIPIFERAAVESIQPLASKKDHLTVALWLPTVDEFSTIAFNKWLGIAHKLLRDVFDHSGDIQAIENIVESMHQQHCKLWLNKTSGGKSLIPILQAAFELGISFISCGAGRYVLGWGKHSRIFERSSNSHDSMLGAQISHRKDLAVLLMKQAGIPVPKGIVIQRQTPIDKRATLQHPPPWVVKPVDKDRGEGVTLGIDNQAALDRAVEEALKLSQAVLVEEQIPGTCHRILIIEGKIAFVIKRNPRAIVGNGIDSIRQLVHDHNSEIKRKIPIKRLPKLVLDDLSNVFLAQSDLNEHSVPAFGQHVALRPVQSSQWGGDPEVMTTQLHPANQEIAIRASKLFNLSCAGIDFISTDITKPWYENGAVINEVNYAPVIGRTHAYQRDGTRAYLSAVFPNQGRIPVEVYLGAQTAEQASQRHRELVNEGIQAIYCHDNDVLNHCFESIPLAQAQTIFDRMQMLRLNGEVEHAVIHINTDDSFSLRGLPFDYVHSVISSPTDQLTTMQIHTLNLLKTFYRTES